MTDELRNLWELHGLDEQVGACLVALGRFDDERKDLARRLEAERARREAAQRRLGDLQMRRRSLEKDIDATAADEKKFQIQLFSVKKNEEYQALLHEIEAVKKRRSDTETSVLQIMDEEESAQRERQEA